MQHGITLISLVITIIVLIILAGVAINAAIDSNGLFDKASTAKTETYEKTLEEKILLAYLSSLAAGAGKVDYNVLNSELANLGFNRGEQEEDGTYPNDIKGLPAKVEIDGKEYTITNDGKLGQSEKWAYKEDEKGRKTIVTNGVIELKIGDYINYNAAATDADEKETEKRTVTSNAGSPTTTENYTASTQTITEGNGYEAQTFSNETDTKGWRVLGVDETTGEILIISADSVKTTDGTSFYLRGATGYQYGEGELDKVCGVFGNGYGATRARSVDVDDINKITGYNPKNTGKYDPEKKEIGTPYGNNSLGKYENEITYKWNVTTSGNVDCSGTNETKGTLSTSHSSYGFNWYDKTEKTWKSNATKTGDITTLIPNFYFYYPDSLTDGSSTTEIQPGISATSAEYLTLFCDSSGTKMSYWLASAQSGINSSEVGFGMFYVSGSSYINARTFYSSSGTVGGRAYNVRPVVYLKSDINLQYDSEKEIYDIIEK